MLILTRRVGEKIMLGDDVIITVMGVTGNQVRLGADAPKSIAVHREEIYQRIQNEKLDRPVIKEPKRDQPKRDQPKRDQPKGNEAKTIEVKVKRRFDSSTQTFPSDSNLLSKVKKVFV